MTCAVPEANSVLTVNQLLEFFRSSWEHILDVDTQSEWDDCSSKLTMLFELDRVMLSIL